MQEEPISLYIRVPIEDSLLLQAGARSGSQQKETTAIAYATRGVRGPLTRVAGRIAQATAEKRWRHKREA